MEYLGKIVTQKDLTNKLYVDNKTPFFPDFNELTPIETHEYDVASTAYRKVFTRSNVDISSMKNIDDEIWLRIIIDSTANADIYQVADVIVKFDRQKSLLPHVIGWNSTYSTSSANTGYRYFRVEYPKALNNGADWDFTINFYNATARHIIIQVFKKTDTCSFYDTAVTTTYNSNLQSTSSCTFYTNQGFITNYTQPIGVTSSTSASYVSGRISSFMGGTPPIAGEALVDGGLVFIAENNKIYKISNKVQPINTNGGIFGCRASYNANASTAPDGIVRYWYWSNLTKDADMTKDTLSRGDEVYLRCTMKDGKVYSDGHLTNQMSANYTWVKIGVAYSDTAISIDTAGSKFYTLNDKGKISHINGMPLAGMFEDLNLETTKVGSASDWSAGSLPSLGTNISADDITSWSAGSLPTLGNSINFDAVKTWSAGSLPTLGLDISADDITSWSDGSLPELTITTLACDDITSWETNTPADFSVSGGILNLSKGKSASLSYTGRNVGSASGWKAGTKPSLSYTARSIPNITSVGELPDLSTEEKSVPNVTAVGTLPDLKYTSRSIPNVTSVGTLPSITITETTVATGQFSDTQEENE